MLRELREGIALGLRYVANLCIFIEFLTQFAAIGSSFVSNGNWKSSAHSDNKWSEQDSQCPLFSSVSVAQVWKATTTATEHQQRSKYTTCLFRVHDNDSQCLLFSPASTAWGPVQQSEIKYFVPVYFPILDRCHELQRSARIFYNITVRKPLFAS